MHQKPKPEARAIRRWSETAVNSLKLQGAASIFLKMCRKPERLRNERREAVLAAAAGAAAGSANANCEERATTKTPARQLNPLRAAS